MDETAQRKIIWTNLVAWVESPAAAATETATGAVHRHLELRGPTRTPARETNEDDNRPVSCNTTTNHHHRGVFCHQPIARGEVLIRLPRRLAIHGEQHCGGSFIPDSATTPPSGGAFQRASPWLRALAAFLQATDTTGAVNARETRVVSTRQRREDSSQPDAEKTFANHDDDVEPRQAFLPYIKSLPPAFETLWKWSDEQIDEFLAGTTPPQSTDNSSAARIGSWKMMDLVRQNYTDHVRPFLIHCGLVRPQPCPKQEWQRFEYACQALSTRSFHLDAESDTNAAFGRTGNKVHPGPYILPVIDLVNHSYRSEQATIEPSQKSTCSSTRVQLVDDCFCMIAERDLFPGEEVLHSYGDQLCSSQFLASYGFVPECLMKRAATVEDPDSFPLRSSAGLPWAPIYLSKMEIWECCWEIIESDVPQQLAIAMKEMDDETWPLTIDKNRKADYVPDHIVLSVTLSAFDEERPDRSNRNSLLTDEIVTAACVPFLPLCAYAEITEYTLLDRSILQDYFLGQLVGMSLIKVIQRQRSLYRPISIATIQRVTSVERATSDSSYVADTQLLRDLLNLLSFEDCDVDIVMREERLRLAYGLTLRIEEKNLLASLVREVGDFTAALNDLEEKWTRREDSSPVDFQEANTRPRKS